VVTVKVALLLGMFHLAGCTFVNGTPTVGFSYAPVTCFTDVPVAFRALTSGIELGEIIAFSWTFGDGTSGIGDSVEHVYTRAGEFFAVLTATLPNGESVSASRRIVVSAGLVVPSAYGTIQAAIDAAEDGETIIVMPGSYAETLIITDRTITVQSSNPSDQQIVDSTVIRGFEPGRPTVLFGSGSKATLAGFTLLTGPVQEPYCGACFGIVYVQGASPTIRQNRIVNAPDVGMVIRESAAHIDGNRFIGNTSAASGGAIYVDCYRHAPTISGNTFEGNTADSGGAIYITYTGSIRSDEDGQSSSACAAMTLVTGNTFRSNTATQFGGGAIFVEYYGNLRLDLPDSNSYSGNDPDDVFYVVPPSS